MTTLNPYEDHDVLQSTIRVTNAGDGLSQALAVDPVEYHLGEEVHVVLRCEVAKISYDELPDTGGCLRRVHTLKAGTGTIVDAKAVAKALDDQERAIEKAKGVERLDLDGDEDGE